MAATISVPYTIRADSGISESNPPGDASATVKFQCFTSQRYQLIQDLVGTSKRVGKTIVREYPYQYPPSPNLFARSIESVEMIGNPFLLGFGPQWLSKKLSIVTCKFVVPLWDAFGASDPSGQPYTTTTFSISSERLTVPNSVYAFSRSPFVGTQSPVGINLPIISINMQRHMLPYAPLFEMATLAGSVNQFPLVFQNYTFAAQTVLFMGGNVKYDFDSLGNVLFTADYNLSWRCQGWQNFLHPNGTSGWQPVTDGNGNPVYPIQDFSALP